ncbi:glutamate ABC transporter substrate-binding protein [Yinghuangia sp. YIM S09857]|uniref:glutamate ABC transporter substrate-binding protein n=1 Tax=Yinghuangia sp. YIM S09857 TaxID=3436929 RepID=UPI003F52DFED
MKSTDSHALLGRGTRRTTAALAVGIALVVASQGGAGADGAPRQQPRAVPAAPAAPPAPAATDCGDPKLSLRPPASVPKPASWSADSRMQKIVQRGFLIAGVDQSTYPFGYLDPVDATLKGFDIDMLREVAKAIFGDDRPDRIRFRVLLNADRVPAVEQNQVDEDQVDIVAMTMTVNCERRERVDFSDVYFTAGQRTLVQKDPSLPQRVRDEGLAALAGYRVCAVDGSTSLARIKDPQYQAVPVEGETWADCLVKLQKGETDAISTDDTILAGLQAQDAKFTEVVGGRISEEPYAMAINKADAEFVRFVNAVLADVKSSGRWTELYKKHIGTSLNETDPKPPAVTTWRTES